MPLDRVVDGTNKMGLVHQRIDLLGFRDREELEFHAEITAARNHHLEPVKPLRRAGKQESTGDVNTAGLAGDALDLLVEFDGVLLQLRDIRVAVHCVHTAGGMPGRARRELLPFDQENVLPAGLGEVIEHTGTHHTAADHRYLNMCSHTDPGTPFN